MSVVAALVCLLSAAVACGLLAAARTIAERWFDAAEPSAVRAGIWIAGALVLTGAAFFFADGWLFVPLSVLLTFWALWGAAVDVQGGPLRRQLAFVQVYGVLLIVAFLRLRAEGVLAGTSVTTLQAFHLEDLVARSSSPLVHLVVGWLPFPPWGAPEAALGRVTYTLAHHFFALTAVVTFGIAAFCHSFLSERPVRRIGLALLPAATPMALVFAGLAIASRVIPDTTVSTWLRLGTLVLLPFFLAEGLSTVRWLASSLHVGGIIVALLCAVIVAAPPAAFVLAALGWIAHLARVRELGPLLEGVDKPVQRPTLRGAMIVAAVAAVTFIVGEGAFYAATAHASPKLRSSFELCSQYETSRSEDGATVRYASPDHTFVIDADESSADATRGVQALRAVCEERGKRVCTSDEWYVACLCNYPGESEGGFKWWTNTPLVSRVAREKDRSEDRSLKDLDVHRLLRGRSEVVEPTVGHAGVMIAGPAESLSEPWTVDCRHRALVTESALEGHRWPFVGVRCCE